MKRALTLFFLWLGTLNGWAQAPSPAQVGITTAVPNVVQVYDSSHNWATLGSIDPTTHIFTLAGYTPYVLPTASTTVLGGVKVDGSTININGSGVISGTPPAITANSTPTSAFLANQLMISDGTKTQAVKSGTLINLGDVPGPGYPIYIFPLSTSSGFYPHLQITGQASDNYGISIFTGGNSGKNGINMGAGPSSGLPYNFFGFTSTNDSSNPSPDIAFTSSGRGIAAFRDFGDGTRPESLRVYNSFTDFNNGEWGGIDWQSNLNVMTIGPSANGTGTLRSMVVGSGGDWLSFNPAGFVIMQAPYFYAQNNGQLLGAPWSYWGAVYSDSFVTGGLTGVSCAAGTVTLATLVVTKGIVTHC